MTGYGVGAEQTNDGRDPGFGQSAQSDFWRAGRGARFATAANQVYMLIDKARTQDPSLEIDNLTIRHNVRRDIACNGNNLAVGEKHVANPLIFRGIKVRTLQ